MYAYVCYVPYVLNKKAPTKLLTTIPACHLRPHYIQTCLNALPAFHNYSNNEQRDSRIDQPKPILDQPVNHYPG